MFHWLKVLQHGQTYMTSWPMDKRLNPVFAENRVIKATRFAIRFMPPLIVVLFLWHYWLSGSWAPTIVTSLFAFSLPLQGLYWLGRRSGKTLPEKLQRWYHDIQQKLILANVTYPKTVTKITYQDLANILSIAFKHLDNDFLERL